METTLEKKAEILKEKIITNRQRIQARQMQKYVWGLVGIWFIFLGTFIIAYLKVCNEQKYTISPFMTPVVLPYGEKN
jgi:hypothetical protein